MEIANGGVDYIEKDKIREEGRQIGNSEERRDLSIFNSLLVANYYAFTCLCLCLRLVLIDACSNQHHSGCIALCCADDRHLVAPPLVGDGVSVQRAERGSTGPAAQDWIRG